MTTLRCQRCAGEIFHKACELCSMAEAFQALVDSLSPYNGFARRAKIPIQRARGMLLQYRNRYPSNDGA